MKQKSENIYFQPLIFIDMRGGITQNSWITCVVSFCSSAVSHLLKRNKEKLNVTCVCDTLVTAARPHTRLEVLCVWTGDTQVQLGL